VSTFSNPRYSILDPRMLDHHVPLHRKRGALFPPTDPPEPDPDPHDDMFLDAMTNMQEAMKKFGEAIGKTGEAFTKLMPQVAYQNAVIRDCHLNPEERAAQDDALWECQALAIRLEPQVFQAEFRMFGTTMLSVHHGLFTRDVVVQVFSPYTDEEYPPEDFQVFPESINVVSIQFVGHAFRKPPFSFSTQAQRADWGSESAPSSLRVRVSA
jgi:hypothetical protein